MKFGKYLEAQKVAELSDGYLDYEKLKNMLTALGSTVDKASPALDIEQRATSLTTKKAGSTAIRQVNFEGKLITETDFFTALEEEMSKVDAKTHAEQNRIKSEVEALKRKLGGDLGESLNAQAREKVAEETKSLGDKFLRIEKFVNLNYLGFHKILKKHDKLLPTPCRKFYLTRLHNQRWIRHDYSKLFVELSKIHSDLRGDKSGKNEDLGGQSFVRTTTKFWVRTENVSRVKHIVLQHLPVFQFNLDALHGDSQFCSSVYFDNTHMELYHGRLDKTPGAIAVRFRWYATPAPELVFVERKTHHDSWTGEVSVKERFTLKESQVIPFLRGEYTLKDKLDEMRQKGKSEADIANTKRLFTEIYQQIESKQLRPTMRTVYNRVAYQIPFDATVRISLDSNLTMIAENPKVGPDCATEKRWYRNPNVVLPPTDITQFPHAVLEVKLSLKEGQDAPKWVSDLIESGLCVQVHKFSKFIHGCATLLPDQVQAFPYWIDDLSIRPSILRSQPIKQRRSVVSAPKSSNNHARVPIQLMERKRSMIGFADADDTTSLMASVDPLTSELMEKPRKTPMKIEPKVFFSNERTLLAWLHISITIGSLSAVLLGFSTRNKLAGTEVNSNVGPHLMGFTLMPVSVLFAVYAFNMFLTRRKYLRLRLDDGHFFDENGPFFLGMTLVTALGGIFVFSL